MESSWKNPPVNLIKVREVTKQSPVRVCTVAYSPLTWTNIPCHSRGITQGTRGTYCGENLLRNLGDCVVIRDANSTCSV